MILRFGPTLCSNRWADRDISIFSKRRPPGRRHWPRAVTTTSWFVPQRDRPRRFRRRTRSMWTGHSRCGATLREVRRNMFPAPHRRSSEHRSTGATSSIPSWITHCRTHRDTGHSTGGNGFLKLSLLRHSVITVLLVEKLMQPGEISPAYTSPIARGKTTYTHFTGRHNKGGHLLFADGHAQWFSWAEVQPPPTGLSAANGAANLPNKIISNPFQAPLY